MKLLTIAVPCYNSADYMEHCLDSLLPGGSELDIIIIDDGSNKDNTAEIAERYAKKYPDRIRVIHQENGGHGAAVNTGLAHAEGFFFKVVDSDDWLEKDAFLEVLAKLRELLDNGTPPDMFLANFTYIHAQDHTSHIMNYSGKMPENRLFSWEELGHFRTDQQILMHSVIYRTALLRECGLKLPEHCFYVDNIFVYQPLPFVKTLFYLNVNLYCYYIGRSDQSVNEDVMIGRVDEQLKITRFMLHLYNPVTLPVSKRLRDYMLHYLSMMILISSVFLVLSHRDENEDERRKLWHEIRDIDEKLYRQLRYRHICGFADMPIIRRRQILGNGYRLARKIYKFN